MVSAVGVINFAGTISVVETTSLKLGETASVSSLSFKENARKDDGSDDGDGDGDGAADDLKSVWG